MRSLRLVAALVAAMPLLVGAACSSGSDKAAAPGAAGAAGGGGEAGASGAAGAGGSSAPAGGTDGAGGAGAGTGAGAGPTGAGAGSSLCKTGGDGAIFSFQHPDCQSCALASCDTEHTAAYGAAWSKGDPHKQHRRS